MGLQRLLTIISVGLRLLHALLRELRLLLVVLGEVATESTTEFAMNSWPCIEVSPGMFARMKFIDLD